MSYSFASNKFNLCKLVTWEDVIKKMDVEFINQQHKIIVDLYSAPTIILHSDYYPESILKAFDEVEQELGINVLHVYTSLGRNARTFGRHCDPVDVVIVQSIGNICYEFDCGERIELSPGDALHIPKGVYHNPIVFEPRVTLSFSWE